MARVALGDDLMEYLKSLSQRQQQCNEQDEEDIEVCKRMADVCMNMIVSDLDGRMILDYLGKERAL